MASKDIKARLNQKAYWEEKLNMRLSVLAERDMESKKITKDIAVRGIRAKLRETETRLKTISDMEKKVKEMARIKEEKKAVPKKEKGKKQKVSGEKTSAGKRQQKKKKEKENKSS